MPITDVNFQVYGPATVWIRTTPALYDATAPTDTDGFSRLGVSDNDDLFKFEEEHLTKDISCVTDGTMPGEIVYLGSKASLSVTLVKWDHAVVEKIQDQLARVMTMGAIGTVGLTTLNGPLTGEPLASHFQLLLVPDSTSLTQYSYWFKACVLTDPVEYMDFGNTARRVGLRIQVARAFNTTTGLGNSVLYSKVAI